MTVTLSTGVKNFGYPTPPPLNLGFQIEGCGGGDPLAFAGELTKSRPSLHYMQRFGPRQKKKTLTKHCKKRGPVKRTPPLCWQNGGSRQKHTKKTRRQRRHVHQTPFFTGENGGAKSEKNGNKKNPRFSIVKNDGPLCLA